MSKLNIYHHELRHKEYAEFYLKYEADKVIAEKDEEIVELKKQVHDYALCLYVMQAKAEKEARHDKYKRCLAMAEYCASELEIAFRDPFIESGIKGCVFFRRWLNKWRELAEKFKEAK